LVASGVAFHIVARGNYRQTVFFADGDHEEYLSLLGRHAASESLEILGWCLMTNHVHLLVVPQQRKAPSKPRGGSLGTVGWTARCFETVSKLSPAIFETLLHCAPLPK